MSDPVPGGIGLGILAFAALIVCCAAPLLISAGVVAAVGTWLGNGIVLAVAAVLTAAAVGYALYLRRRAARPSGR